MKKLSLMILGLTLYTVSFAQNGNSQNTTNNNSNQSPIITPQNPNQPQREVIVPRNDANVAPPQNQIPASQSDNATYENNSQFYNKDNNVEPNTNSVPQSNGAYTQPGYSNPANRSTIQNK